MISKNELKLLTSYKHSKYRNEDNIFVVEGIKMTQELLASNFEIIAIYAADDLWITENESYIRSKTIPLHEITTTELQKISSLTTPNKVYCVVKQNENGDVCYENQLTLVLESIKDPGNFGTIMRLADWFGVKTILCSQDCVDVFNPKSVQASMGSIFRVNVIYNNLEGCLQNLPQGFPIFGTLPQNGKNIYDASLSNEGIIIIGSESFGISKEIKAFVNQPLTIPRFSIQKDKPESLNASMATAIILSEFRKRL
ncbi:MAG: RNA methyltransferase [Bacteroidales bacterium]|jgi:TrmH family RNA methyltransferase|nr:RNA methyltransferase [Bacteroidales bacterium]